MRIGIISDTHGSAEVWRAVMKGPFSGVDVILHAGDVLYHGPRNPLPEGYDPGSLAELINSCPVPVLIARGNCDAAVDQVVTEWPLESSYVFAQLGELRVLVSHGHELDEEQMVHMAEKYKLDLFVSGHTHVPMLRRSGRCLFINPGSPALPKQERAVPTAGLIEGNEIAIVDVVSGERLIALSLKPGVEKS